MFSFGCKCHDLFQSFFPPFLKLMHPCTLGTDCEKSIVGVSVGFFFFIFFGKNSRFIHTQVSCKNEAQCSYVCGTLVAFAVVCIFSETGGKKARLDDESI